MQQYALPLARCSKTRCSKTQYGFTLLELLVVLALIAILASVGYPEMRAFNERNAHRVAVSQLQSALALARHSAITLNTDVFLLPQAAEKNVCDSDWNQALLIVAHNTRTPLEPDNILRVLPSSDACITYNRGWRRVKFSTLGHSSGYNGRFTICSAGTASAGGTELILSQLGRLRIKSQPADCS
jgi:type IV fimbrial biogenesis protein FimT